MLDSTVVCRRALGCEWGEQVTGRALAPTRSTAPSAMAWSEGGASHGTCRALPRSTAPSAMPWSEGGMGVPGRTSNKMPHPPPGSRPTSPPRSLHAAPLPSLHTARSGPVLFQQTQGPRQTQGGGTPYIWASSTTHASSRVSLYRGGGCQSYPTVVPRLRCAPRMWCQGSCFLGFVLGFV